MTGIFQPLRGLDEKEIKLHGGDISVLSRQRESKKITNLILEKNSKKRAILNEQLHKQHLIQQQEMELTKSKPRSWSQFKAIKRSISGGKLETYVPFEASAKPLNRITLSSLILK